MIISFFTEIPINMERILINELQKWKENPTANHLSLRTSLLPYSKNKEEGIVNLPLYLLFALHEELAGV